MAETMQVDVAILGAGPVGLSLALALADSHLSVALLDTFPAPRAAVPASAPERTIALSLGSSRILASLGVAAYLDDAAPITHIQVSQAGLSGVVRLDAGLLGESFLGQVVELDRVRAAIAHTLPASTNLVQMATGPLQALQQHGDAVTVHSAKGVVRAQLLVGADGGQGGLAPLAGLARLGWDHNRYACIASVKTARAPAGIAYEHFLPSGPLAFLPFTEDRFSIVWSLTPSEAARLQTLDDAGFLDQLNRHLPPGLGRVVATGPRAQLPLGFQRLLARPDRRLALIGNAAQTLHPVAGQGFNLGLRDAVTLAAMLKAAAERGEDIGGPLLLSRYLASRRWDAVQVIGFTEGLNRLFSSDFLPLQLARAAGLAALERLPGLKRQLAARAAGLALPAASHTPALTPSGDRHALR